MPDFVECFRYVEEKHTGHRAALEASAYLLNDAVNLVDARVSGSKTKLLVGNEALCFDIIFETLIDKPFVDFAENIEETDRAVTRRLRLGFAWLRDTDNGCLFPCLRKEVVAQGAIEDGSHKHYEMGGKEFKHLVCDAVRARGFAGFESLDDLVHFVGSDRRQRIIRVFVGREGSSAFDFGVHLCKVSFVYRLRARGALSL